MGTSSSSIKDVNLANEVEGKVGAIVNGGKGTKQANTGTMSKEGYKRLLKVEIVGLVFVVVTVWGLLTLPLIFFYIPVLLLDLAAYTSTALATY